jgi:signal transduction histidine kinase
VPFFKGLVKNSRFLARFGAQFRSRLCWRITGAIFLTIFIVEAAILVPSYRNYERDLLVRLNEVGHAGMVSAFAARGPVDDRDLRDLGGALTAATKLRGGSFYRPDGGNIGIFGEAPIHSADQLLRRGPQRVAPDRYEVIWPAQTDKLPVTVVARLDSAAIPGALIAFLWRIGGLVLLISLTVCGMAMFVLSYFVLFPLLKIRTSLLEAQENPADADSFMLPESRNDELGEVVAALNQLLRRVSKAHGEELAMMATMVENSNEGFVVYDGHGEVIYANRACLEFCAVEHMRDLQAHGLPNFVRRDRAESETVIEIGTHGMYAGEATLYDRFDKPTPCFIDISCGEDENGEVIRYYALFNDITDLAQIRLRLEQKNLGLESADQAKSQFLANMSHELRTPLNAIIGFAEVMRIKLFGELGNERYAEYANDIHSSGQHLLQIINDILDLSKIEAGGMELRDEPVDVAVTIAAATRLVRDRAAHHGIAVATEISEALPKLSADRQKLNQILINLLTNSVKFTRDGGTITVSAGIDDGGDLAIAVSDAGIGIPPDRIDQVFTPFGQVHSELHRSSEGTGLGLPLARAMVEMHGGVLSLDSEVDRGTVVTIRFPSSRLIRAA